MIGGKFAAAYVPKVQAALDAAKAKPGAAPAAATAAPKSAEPGMLDGLKQWLGSGRSVGAERDQIAARVKEAQAGGAPLTAQENTLARKYGLKA